MKSKHFRYEYRFAGQVDIGKSRKSNQDEVILSPERGFFAVSDGMGGLEQGGKASEYVKKALPVTIGTGEYKFSQLNAEEVSDFLRNTVRLISDRLYEQGNAWGHIRFGATLAGVLLHDDKAIFVCLGDSRGYLLPKYKKNPVQISEDMNIAGYLVRNGEMTKEQAKNDYRSSRLTAFVGMPEPATPETYIVDVKPGDRILLCSDGLYGMVDERKMARIMRSSGNPETVCGKLIDEANKNGGRDNISAAYIYISARDAPASVGGGQQTSLASEI